VEHLPDAPAAAAAPGLCPTPAEVRGQHAGPAREAQ